VTPVKDPPITDLAMPLLSTKYAAPPRPRRGFVDRQALADAITSARGVLLVCAPPGYGKTTLVAGWATQPSVSCAWLTLDEADNDPVTFGAYLLAAMREAVPGVAPDVAPPATPAALAPLVNALAAHRAECSIVLDDYHAITTRGAHDMTVFLARHLPPNVRLIITTRHDPPLPLARLRARGLLTEIRARDLRFSADDAARFLAGAMGVDISRSAVERLTERTEGWVAGLQLAGLSLRGASDPEAFVEAFGATDRYIFDYLFDETLATQPPLISSFLEATSILGRLSGDLCDAVTGRDDGAEMLAALAGANLFLSPLDDRGGWFRYHRRGAARRTTCPARPSGMPSPPATWPGPRSWSSGRRSGPSPGARRPPCSAGAPRCPPTSSKVIRTWWSHAHGPRSCPGTSPARSAPLGRRPRRSARAPARPHGGPASRRGSPRPPRGRGPGAGGDRPHARGGPRLPEPGVHDAR
jgi:hypothetical protein